MPTIRRTNVIAAGATVENVLAGSSFEFLGVPSIVTVASVYDGAGVSPEADIHFGQEVQSQAEPIASAPAAGRGPLTPDDVTVSDVAAPGDRIIVRITNPDGAIAATVRTLVKITPLQ